jgi:hypothetical protein
LYVFLLEALSFFRGKNKIKAKIQKEKKGPTWQLAGKEKHAIQVRSRRMKGLLLYCRSTSLGYSLSFLIRKRG